MTALSALGLLTDNSLNQSGPSHQALDDIDEDDNDHDPTYDPSAEPDDGADSETGKFARIVG